MNKFSDFFSFILFFTGWVCTKINLCSQKTKCFLDASHEKKSCFSNKILSGFSDYVLKKVECFVNIEKKKKKSDEQ